MKKIYFVALAIITLMLAGCSFFGNTPETSATKLYPAMDPSAENWGYIDNKGNFVISPIFDDVEGFSCGYAIVEMDDEQKFIDKKGAFQTTSLFDKATSFYYGYSTIRLDGSYGLMSKQFDMAIQPYFYYLGLMGDNGLVAAKRSSDSKYEYVNAKGETKIPAMYNGCDNFKDGIAIVTIGSKYGAINASGAFTIQPIYEDGLWNMGKGLVGFRDKNGKYGFMDKNGNSVVPAMYYSLGNVSEGMIVFAGKNKYGYLNVKGEIVIPEMYYTVEPFYEGLAWVRQDEDSKYYQCIDKNNQVIFRLGENEYPRTGFQNGLALVKTEDGYKYINKQGALIYSWSYKNDPYWAPQKAAKATEWGVLDADKTDMTLHFDSRKL